ncbi:unnamed protein product [Didymodactylos carnosus]|uniref:Uncharacterized protein n=1 Tax=Didymodactylos carnosus TaxID=1234261 RepID=A0A813W1Y6_9BILA|nr:unnamed protein product [Didymodactylos carnosus]CAF1092980.1 unnamed protein product [Didymodactylos carnosus]CAF3637279.1 unnamed protein product [Didymodactylos carnosus]CAF3854525.1 unnamed protein product [Didymodactylos carnosus]
MMSKPNNGQHHAPKSTYHEFTCTSDKNEQLRCAALEQSNAPIRQATPDGTLGFSGLGRNTATDDEIMRFSHENARQSSDRNQEQQSDKLNHERTDRRSSAGPGESVDRAASGMRDTSRRERKQSRGSTFRSRGGHKQQERRPPQQ